jgi:hypothetical protein
MAPAGSAPCDQFDPIQPFHNSLSVFALLSVEGGETIQNKFLDGQIHNDHGKDGI